ncbi:MAG TPA: aminopeptidase [Steroidobacteraceae bacterium]|jgi:predicted aminopeptidase|nr:aminopeptidase [Steroidobacteraceae bacterium]
MLTESSTGRAGRAQAALVRAVCAALPRATRALVLTLSCALLGGCYLLQATSGEWRVLQARVPIATVIAAPATPDALRARLTEVQAARDFAVRELGLPDNNSYRSYADLHRPFVVWNVVAAPEFSLAPVRWCFPVAGCVAYRGYFHERRARDFALRLEARGLDAVVEGVPAYSTLGKFADPVLSTMLRYDDDELVATIFHELAHQLLYVPNDSEFNEAFATTVEEVGLARWLEFRGAAQRIERFRNEQRQEAALLALLAPARARLAALYASGVGPDEMRGRKRALLAELAAAIVELERREGVHYPVYEQWMATGLNNAQLASIATYYECVPGFRRLLTAADGDLARFYAAVRTLARAPREERHAQLCTAAASAATPGASG